MLFVEEGCAPHASDMVLPGVTDNRGNEGLICKNMSSKFPVYLVLLELTEQLAARKLSLALSWKCRELNTHADDLTNKRFDDFDCNLRIATPLDQLQWKVLPLLMKEALELEIIVRTRRESRRASLSDRTVTPVKKRKVEGLKTKDPW